MKKLFALGAAMCLFGIVGAGCQNTADGAKQDAQTDTAAVKEAGDKAAVATEKAASDTVEATKEAADKAKSAADKAAVATEKAATDTAVATKEAADKAAAATAKATDRMVSAADKATKNAGDALGLTPTVKLAITNDDMLNNTANLINVESADNKVRLTGHVMTKQMKMRAQNLAMHAVKTAGSNDKVVNELTIEPK